MPSDQPPHLRAVIRFLTQEEGGRATDPAPGYHPQLKIGDMHTSCVIDPAQEAVTFTRGETIEVIIKPIFYEQVKDAFLGLTEVELYEGSRKIAQGYFRPLDGRGEAA